MAYRYYLLLIYPIFITGCASMDYTSELVVKPVNTNINAKWIIDEPDVPSGKTDFAAVTYESYLKAMGEDFGTVTPITELKGIGSLRKALETDIKVLNLYKEKTDYDYVIETSMRLLKNDLPVLQLDAEPGRAKELELVIRVYDINKTELLLQKEYHFTEIFEGNEDIALSSKRDKFISRAIKAATKNLAHPANWSAKGTINQ